MIGEDHLRAKFEAAGCAMDTFRCKTVKGSTDGVPWIIEAASRGGPRKIGDPEKTACTERQLITGVNWSPGIVNPFRSLGYGRGLESLLAEKFAGPQEPCMLVHLACPRVTYTDRGKSAIVMNSRADADALLDAVTAVTRSWTRQRKAELRDRSREISRRDALARRRRVTIKDAAWRRSWPLPTGMPRPTRPSANARQIMYAARPDILRLTRRDQLDDDYFTQTLLPDYMAEHPDDCRVGRGLRRSRAFRGAAYRSADLSRDDQRARLPARSGDVCAAPRPDRPRSAAAADLPDLRPETSLWRRPVPREGGLR